MRVDTAARPGDDTSKIPGPGGKADASCTERYSSQFKNNCLAEMWSGSEEGSYLRLIDGCITQLWA